MSAIHEKTLTALPAVISLDGADADAFIAYYRGHEPEINDLLRRNGAVKFRGVRVETLPTFEKIVHGISGKFLNYIDGNSPRTKLSGNVYTSTEYDPSQKITMHNELSYSAKWPNKLFFSCLQVAETGGETLLADSREMLRRMDKAIVARIEAKGITYIRNLHGGLGMGPSWQETFETHDKNTVGEYCKAYGIDFEWRDNDGLRLKQRRRGIIEHRESRERVWFNQIDQFHPLQLGEELYQTMLAFYESPEEFPTYVRFGDGEPVSEDMVREILETIGGLTLAPPWQPHELLMLDNELVSHGRNPFTGSRKVLVAMSE